MNWAVPVGVAIVVVLLGGVAARAWWNLAHKAAPYGDDRSGVPASGEREDDAVIIRDEEKRDG
jgi:hypothetical protein